MNYTTEDLQHLLDLNARLEKIDNIDSLKDAYRRLAQQYRVVYRKAKGVRDEAVWQLKEAGKVITDQQRELQVLNQIVEDLMANAGDRFND